MKAKKLIDILLDNSATISERDDAAMDLSAFDSNNVVYALIKAGSDNSNNEIILSSVGESLAEIWIRNDSFSLESYTQLCDATKFAVKENMAEKLPTELS